MICMMSDVFFQIQDCEGNGEDHRNHVPLWHQQDLNWRNKKPTCIRNINIHMNIQNIKWKTENAVNIYLHFFYKNNQMVPWHINDNTIFFFNYSPERYHRIYLVLILVSFSLYIIIVCINILNEHLFLNFQLVLCFFVFHLFQFCIFDVFLFIYNRHIYMFSHNIYIIYIY